MTTKTTRIAEHIESPSLAKAIAEWLVDTDSSQCDFLDYFAHETSEASAHHLVEWCEKATSWSDLDMWIPENEMRAFRDFAEQKHDVVLA